MAKSKLERKAYKEFNKNFLIKKAKEDEIITLDQRVLYRVITSGTSSIKPSLNSVVSVFYKGTLIDGSVFDSNLENPYPEAMRLRELIEGWQIALQQMCVGDRWEIFIPYNVGYGDRGVDNIPAFSTLIFEIELVGVN